MIDHGLDWAGKEYAELIPTKAARLEKTLALFKGKEVAMRFLAELDDAKRKGRMPKVRANQRLVPENHIKNLESTLSKMPALYGMFHNCRHLIWSAWGLLEKGSQLTSSISPIAGLACIFPTLPL